MGRVGANGRSTEQSARTELLFAQVRLVHAVHVHLLDETRERRLSRLSHLLVLLLRLVEVDRLRVQHYSIVQPPPRN